MNISIEETPISVEEVDGWVYKLYIDDAYMGAHLSKQRCTAAFLFDKLFNDDITHYLNSYLWV